MCNNLQSNYLYLVLYYYGITLTKMETMCGLIIYLILACKFRVNRCFTLLKIL